MTTSINLIQKYHHYDDTKIEEIKYGLEGLYIVVTKAIVILSLAHLLGILKEVLLFMLIYNIIKWPSFGLHTKTSFACLVLSSFIFLGFPIFSQIIYLSLTQKVTIGIICTALIFKNAPADTHKRPIINIKKRKFYRILSTLISIIFTVMAVTIFTGFIGNLLLSSLIVQAFMTAPTTYKLFNLPSRNYLNYVPST